ncbi:Magnesium and cobalt efflux protein CorC [Phycisphaerae bacterium RAS1]|nr:Magnesium and cobalt efflux protein CorC [Phycisphaerae bacterium RAS1]
MVLTCGAGLLALILVISTLSYVLRDYSPSRLAERLGESSDRAWLEWLDRCGSELLLLTSVVRLAANFSLLLLVAWAYLGSDPPAIGAREILIPIGITLALLAVFGIGVPHALAVHAGESILSKSLWGLVLLRAALWPLARLLAFVQLIVERLLGKSGPDAGQEVERVEQEILEAVQDGQLQGAVDDAQREMIRSVFELQQTTVSAIMTPRTDIAAIPADSTMEQVRAALVASGHSRLPVFENSLDHIIGVLYVKDLLKLAPGAAFEVRSVMRVAPYVPETKTIADLLTEFRQRKVQIAIVLDEYGGTAGLATIEDILEELVGEIDDEYDQPPPPMLNHIDEDTIDVDARASIYQVNEALRIELPEDEGFETVGGFVFAAMGKIPSTGETFKHENVQLEVIDAEARKIRRLRIHVAREEAAEAVS